MGKRRRMGVIASSVNVLFCWETLAKVGSLVEGVFLLSGTVGFFFWAELAPTVYMTAPDTKAAAAGYSISE